MSTVVLSIRISKELKEEAESLGIDVKKVVEEALKRAIYEEKVKRIARALQELAEALSDVSEDEWIRVVKSSRVGRYPH